MWYRKVLCYEKKKKKKENTKILRKQNSFSFTRQWHVWALSCNFISPTPPPPTSDQYNIPNKLRFQLFDNDVPS